MILQVSGAPNRFYSA